MKQQNKKNKNLDPFPTTNRNKSTLDWPASNQERVTQFVPPLLVSPESGELNRKNWTCLTTEVRILFFFSVSLTCLFLCLLITGLLWVLRQAAEETTTACKTWDGPSGSSGRSAGADVTLELVQRSYTAPDRTGIRIYYSPPAVRRAELQRRIPGPREPEQNQNGTSSTAEVSQSSSSYEQWLSSLSKQHRELLESRSACVSVGSIPLACIVSSGSSGSANSLVDGMAPSPSPFHTLEMGEIAANLSDDMKEMTNCVRQAIRSSSLERKSSKESGSQVVLGFTSFISSAPFSQSLACPATSHQAPTNITLFFHYVNPVHSNQRCLPRCSSPRRSGPPPGPRRRPTTTLASGFKPTHPFLAPGGRGSTPRPGLRVRPPPPPRRWPLHVHGRSPPRWTKYTAASIGLAARPSTARPSCSAECPQVGALLKIRAGKRASDL